MAVLVYIFTISSWVICYYICRPLIKLPARMVGYLNLFLEWMHKQLGFTKCNRSLFHYIQLASHSKTFNCSAAQKHIGYSPVVPHKVSFSWVYLVFNVILYVWCTGLLCFYDFCFFFNYLFYK